MLMHVQKFVAQIPSFQDEICESAFARKRGMPGAGPDGLSCPATDGRRSLGVS